IAQRHDGSVVIAGSQPGSAGSTSSNTLPRAAFVSQLSETGAIQWTRLLNSTASAVGAAVAVAPDDTLVVTGSFSGTLDLGSGLALDAGGVHSAFVTRL